MNRNIAKPFMATLSLLDVATDKTHKYKCFHGEDVQLTVNVVGEDQRPLDLSNTSVKIYFTLDKNVNEPVYRQDTGIVVDNLGVITVMLEKSYIRIGNNTLKIVLYDEDQTVFLQPLIISCIDPLIGEVADLEIPDDINVRDEIYDIRRIIGDLQDFDDDLGREIIEARNEYGTVGRRLDNFDSQLEQSENMLLNTKNPQVEITKKPVLVFIDDDIRKETYTFWHRLAQELGIKISLACIPEWIEEGQSTTTVPTGKEVMTMEELKEMYDYGHDILAHGYDTRSIKDFLNNPTELKHQLYDCREWIKNKGFTRNRAYNYFVYPQGLTGTTEEILKTKAEVRKYYQYGINAFTTEKNVSGVFDSFNIPRVSSDGVTSETLKAELDKVIANKGMMIVLSHAWHSQDLDGDNYETWATRYRDLVSYARANKVEIMPFSEAIKIKGNSVSIGEYTSRYAYYLNNDGTEYNGNVISIEGELDKPLNDYPYGFTCLQLQTSHDSVFKVGGHMIIYRGYGTHFSYEIIMLYNSNRIYKRRYDDTNKKWLDFELISHIERTCFSYVGNDSVITGNNTFTKIPFSVALTNDLGTFSTADNTFTTLESGNYSFNVVISSKTTITELTNVQITVYKNGTIQQNLYSGTIQPNSTFSINVNSKLKLNKNDVIDIRIKTDKNITLYGHSAYNSITITK